MQRYVQTTHTGKSHQIKSIRTAQEDALMQEADAETEEYLADDDTDEEELNTFFAGKDKMLVRCCQALSCLFLLSYLNKRLKALPPVAEYTPAPKYLTLRVLRI